jgi:membrane protein DedA with SNARE-associated domain
VPVSAITSLSVGSPLSYLIAFLLPCLDAVLPVLPVLPSETVIIAFGVATAGSADPRIFLIVAVAAAGAWSGDNLSYLIGWRFGPWATRRFFSGDKGAARRDWAESSLRRFGMGLIIVCRFIPGGRTAVTLSCGLVRYSWRRFAVATAVAAVLWAAYAFLAGRIGGKAFEDKPVAGFAVAFGAAFVVSGIVEGIRRLIKWRRGSRKADAGEASPGN